MMEVPEMTIGRVRGGYLRVLSMCFSQDVGQDQQEQAA